ncbi:PAS domain S-box protein [Flavobacterium faecale]|nr:PAS domain S-box protein [Flavobacterium faecale]
MENYLSVVQQDFEKTLKNSYTTTLSLALTINDEGNPAQFEAISKKLIAANPNLDCVQLVPNGIITYVYPYEANKAALGFNVLKSKSHRAEALKSIESQKIYFAGPIDLLQGGKGIVGRLPIYKNNKFWGFSAVVIRLDNIVSFFEKHSPKNANYDIQLSKINPITKKEDFYLNGPTNLKNLQNVSATISDGGWKLYLIDKNPASLIDSKIIMIGVFGFILSILFGFLTTSILQIPIDLRSLLEQQAGTILESELKFKTFFDQAAVGIANISKDDGKFITINNKFASLLGYSTQEMKTKSFMEITHPEDLEIDLEHLNKLKNGEINKYAIEKRYFKKNGKIIWVKLTVSKLKTSDGFDASYISIVENISKRKIAEKKSKEYQKKIESLINTIDGIVWECEAETFQFNFVSNKVETILGYTPQEWLASPTFWQDHIHPDDKPNTLNFCSNKLKLLEDHDFEYRMIAKDGSVVWLRDIVNVIQDKDGASCLRGIMIDITKTKLTEYELHNSFDLVTEQNKRLLNFSYIVSHNLRSHTSNIISLTDLIQTADSEKEIQEYVCLLQNVSNALNETLENLNEVVNIQSNLGLVIENIKPNEYIANAIEILSDKIKLKGVAIQTSIGDNISLRYNPAYFESILYNLISNAIRYSHPDRVPEISIDVVEEDNTTVLTVTDNGIGIDLEKQGDKMFGMYKKFTNNPESKGIGLFITKNQIEAMGGRITVESKPNIGTTFKIYIS